MTQVSIYHGHNGIAGAWAGDGWLANGQIVDCAAILGDNQDESDEVYAALEAALAR